MPNYVSLAECDRRLRAAGFRVRPVEMAHRNDRWYGYCNGYGNAEELEAQGGHRPLIRFVSYPDDCGCPLSVLCPDCYRRLAEREGEEWGDE